jgi:hypothetical protein
VKTLKIGLLILVFLGFGISGASAALIGLYDYAFNIDGVISEPILGDPVPPVANIIGFNDLTGLGSISVTISGVGPHYVGLFVDHEIDNIPGDPADNTFFNEYGDTTGALAAGQSWEIDEPAFEFGDIRSYTIEDPPDTFTNYDGNFELSSLDTINNVPMGFEDDVSMALAYNFTLGALEFAMIDFLVTDDFAEITTPFYLTHTDPDSNNGEGASIYFSSSLDIKPVPEPGTMLLVGTGLVGLAGWRRRRSRK